MPSLLEHPAHTNARAHRATWLALALALALIPRPTHAQTILQDFPVTDGVVYASAIDGNTLYLGGAFTYVGPRTGSGVPVDTGTGLAIPGFPHVVGRIRAVVSDGAGGWYIGGDVTSVGGLPRQGAAHILADNSVDGWNPSPDAAVLALAFDGTNIYAGGLFLSIGGQSRNRIAALDPVTGLATAWNPNATSGSVQALVASGGVVYAAGSFVNIGGQPRNRIAAIDVTTGNATTWNPNSSGTVSDLALSGSRLFASGNFGMIGGAPRSRVAGLDLITGNATGFDPGFVDNMIQALAVAGNVVYIGGNFTGIGMPTTFARNCIAALDATTGLLLGWNPNSDSNVLALVVDGGTVYAGGYFTSIGGQPRFGVAALSAASGLATAWDPETQNLFNALGATTAGVQALALAGGSLYVGGGFMSLGGKRRTGLAAVDIPSGQVTAWDPGVNDTIKVLVAGGGRLYAGGRFTSIAGQPRNRIAAFDLPAGTVATWDPNADQDVRAIAVDASTVYAGGDFTSIGGQSRNHVAALDAGTGAAAPAWDPNADGPVYALAAGGSTVYAGGSFANIGGGTRANLAALGASDGLATAWSPDPTAMVRALLTGPGIVYVGGDFGSIAATVAPLLAGVDATTGSLIWKPLMTGNSVRALCRSRGAICAGGVFYTLAGVPHTYVAAIHPTTAVAESWDPVADNPVNTLASDGTSLYAGGEFTAMNTVRTDFLASLPSPDPAYAILASAGANGTISPPGTTPLGFDASQGYTITPDVSYIVDDVVVDGVSQGAVTSYTFSNVQANHTIAATFRTAAGVGGDVVTEFALSPVSPNPAPARARIRLAMPREARVRLSLHDIQGREVRVLANGLLPAGRHEVDLRTGAGEDPLPAGLYFIRYRVPGHEFVRRFTLVE